jgi:peptidoglycan hydrolase FlgJ
MAISPTSDLILDVARAADPQRASAATRALVAGASTGGGVEFSRALDGVTGLPSAYAYRNPILTRSAAETPAHKAAVGFESMLLRSFVDQMLPKDAAGVFGAGVAGDVWKSVLAEKIADEMAKSGALKLSEKLFESHPDLLRSGGTKHPAPTPQQS